MEVPIKSSTIPYLAKDILDLYATVRVIPNDKQSKIWINPLTLLAFSDLFQDCLEPNEEVWIISEFDSIEIKMVTDFISEGILPLPMQDLLDKKIPTSISQVFKSFGIDLEEILAPPTQPHWLSPLLGT